MPTSHANRVRIIGGAFRGRVVRFPASVGLRPTPDRVRETLFNWLGQDLTGKRCLDLYAGSGALALEAASRGASLAVAIDTSRALAAPGVLAVLTGADLKRRGLGTLRPMVPRRKQNGVAAFPSS